MSVFTSLLLLPSFGIMALAGNAQGQQNAKHAQDVTPAVQQSKADTVHIDAAGAGSVSGTAIVTHSAMGASVALTLSGLKSGKQYAAEIHRGMCGADGAMEVTLNGITAGPSGQGKSSTSLPSSEMQGHGAYAIDINSAGGQTVACGQISPQGSGM